FVLSVQYTPYVQKLPPPCPILVYHFIHAGNEKPKKVKPVKPRARDKVRAENIFCPQCGEPLVFEGGCNTCKNCGWSKCY
ncbi:hypothetical protein, partial [Megasphaera hexanoica]|uniref:hypothetical protein n=1 Tax=Megasphaera hexanoica TaxID=1675036 RepID=UPI001981AEB7